MHDHKVDDMSVLTGVGASAGAGVSERSVAEFEDFRGLSMQLEGFNDRLDALECAGDDWLSAVLRILRRYISGLENRYQDLRYFLQPTVVDRIPSLYHGQNIHDSREYVQALEACADQADFVDPRIGLTECIEGYLSSEQQMFAILGEAGSGKSLLSWYASLRLLESAIVALESKDQRPIYLPLVIELKHCSSADLPNLLIKYLKFEGPIGLGGCLLDTTKLSALQNETKTRLLVIYDGLDELGLMEGTKVTDLHDLHSLTKGLGWANNQIKSLCTCRLKYFPNEQDRQAVFGVGPAQLYQERVILALSASQIEHVIAAQAWLDKDPEGGRPVASATISPEHYREMLARYKPLRALVRNPLLLRLYLEALSELIRDGVSVRSIKRYQLYEHIISAWFDREVRRLSKDAQTSLGVKSRYDMITHSRMAQVKKRYLEYVGMLVMQMYAHKTLNINFEAKETDAIDAKLWQRVKDEVRGNVEPRLRFELEAEYAAFDELDIRLLASDGIDSESQYIEENLPSHLSERGALEEAMLEHFKLISPLTCQGQQCRFIHQSFYEYHLANEILKTVGSEEEASLRAKRTVGLLNTAPERRFYQELKVIEFIADAWIDCPDAPEIARARETLFRVVELSKALRVMPRLQAMR